MIRWMLLAALAASPAAAQASSQPAPAQEAQPAAVQGKPDDVVQPPKRIRNVLLFGDEQCPKAENPDEIVVCAHGGDSPYRIPKQFRERVFSPANNSWVRRVEVIQDVNRAVLPGSCSTIGTNGQTGCTRQMLQQWTEAQREKAAAESTVP